MTLTLIPAAMQWVIAGRPARGARDLDHRVGPVHRAPTAARPRGSWPSVSLARVGRHLERHQPVARRRRLVDRRRTRRRPRGRRPRRAPRRSPRRSGPASASRRMSSSYSRLPAIAFSKIVGLEVMPAEAVVGDEPGQLARGDQVAGDVVVPGALAQLAQPHQRVHGRRFRSRSVRRAEQLAHASSGRALGGELELLEQPLARRGSAEAVHGEHRARRRRSSAASRTAMPPRCRAAPGRAGGSTSFR